MAEENGRFGKRTRYSVKESYAQDAKGIIHNSINELNPNVVRIEPLGPAARQAFLGPVHAAADALKLRMAYAMNPEAFKPFYGILTPGDLRGLRLSFQSSWLQENGKSSFERATEILKSPAVAMPLGASAGEAIGNSFGGYDASGFGLGAAAGAITSFIMSGNSNDKDKGNSLTHKLSSFIGDVGTRLGSSMELYGMDSSSTGASTLKTFSKSSMEIPTTLNFTWYMPEQEDLFRLSIHRLLQLAYVRKAYTDRKEFFENLSAATNSGMQQSFVNAKNLKDSLGSVAKAWIDAGNTIVESGEALVGQSPVMKQFADSRNAQLSDAVVDAAGTGVSVGNAIANGITNFTEGWGDKIDANAQDISDDGQFADTGKQNIVNGMNDIVDSVLKAYIEGSTFMGANFVLVPNPVRLTIGNILDVEPMVITNVVITPSEELFINSIGASIPVTMKVTVTLSQWMTPGPDHDFIRLIGDKLFYPIPMKNSEKKS